MYMWCCCDAIQESFNLNVKKQITYDISAKYFSIYTSDINYTVKDVNLLFCFQLQLFPTVRVVRTLVTWQATVASFCYRSVQKNTRTKITQGSFCDKRHISASNN